jgi:chemotaxis protein histidine kinase CheA
MEPVAQDFITYAANLSLTLAAEVRALRANATCGPLRRELLARIFRQVHSLKSLAQAAGKATTAGLAHEFESAVEHLRRSPHPPDEATLDLLDSYAEAFSQTLQVAQMADGMLARLGPQNRKPLPADIALPALPRSLSDLLNEEEKRHCQQAIGEGLTVFAAIIGLDLLSFDNALRELSAALRQTGEVIATQPLGHDEETGYVRFRVLFATRQSASETEPLFAPHGPFALETFASERFTSRRLLETLAEAGCRAARESGKEIKFVISGDETIVDSAETIFPVLLHLVRNAVGHGIESPPERGAAGKHPTGHIYLDSRREEGQTIWRVADDGRGLDIQKLAATAQQQGFSHDDAEPFEVIFRSGFTTEITVTALSGRGVGLEIARETVQALGGHISVASEPGGGATFTLAIPHNR